ncbi:hypothetical protein C7S16_6263 [Burkholderia thailandensis]|uniref:Uncharacterized protein n=1 Tax=Burkholderia thailandensis TaxID=57975 RepID=A0AAW9CQG3_BURTH|nr:hypothetical protein [Burkholderia thailandensis]
MREIVPGAMPAAHAHARPMPARMSDRAPYRLRVRARPVRIAC